MNLRASFNSRHIGRFGTPDIQIQIACMYDWVEWLLFCVASTSPVIPGRQERIKCFKIILMYEIGITWTMCSRAHCAIYTCNISLSCTQCVSTSLLFHCHWRSSRFVSFVSFRFVYLLVMMMLMLVLCCHFFFFSFSLRCCVFFIFFFFFLNSFLHQYFLLHAFVVTFFFFSCPSLFLSMFSLVVWSYRFTFSWRKKKTISTTHRTPAPRADHQTACICIQYMRHKR